MQMDQAFSSADAGVFELTDLDIDAVSGADFWGSVATGAGAGGFAGALAGGPAGAAAGALIGGAVAALLYFDN